MNPACRVARHFPHLPVSRFIFLLSDTDIALYERKFDQSRSCSELVEEYVYKLAPILGEHTVLFILRLMSFAVLLLTTYVLTINAILAALIPVCIILYCLSGRLLSAFYSCYKCGKVFFWVNTNRLSGRNYGVGAGVGFDPSSTAGGADNKSDLDEFVAARVSITMDSKSTRDVDDSSSIPLGISSIYGRDYSDRILYEEHPNLELKILEEKSDRVHHRPISDDFSLINRNDDGEGAVKKDSTDGLQSPRAMKRLRSHVAMDSKSSKSDWRHDNGMISFSQSTTFSDDTLASRSRISASTTQRKDKRETDSMMITDFEDEMTMASPNSIQTKPTPPIANTSAPGGQAEDLSPRSLDSGSSSVNSQKRKLMKLQVSSNRNSSRILVDFDDDISLDKSIFLSPPGRVTKSPLRSFPSSTTTRSRLQLLSPTKATKEPEADPLSASVPVMGPSSRPVSAHRTAMRNKLQQEQKDNLFLSLSMSAAPAQSVKVQQTIAAGPGRQAKEMNAPSGGGSNLTLPERSQPSTSSPFSPGSYLFVHICTYIRSMYVYQIYFNVPTNRYT